MAMSHGSTPEHSTHEHSTHEHSTHEHSTPSPRSLPGRAVRSLRRLSPRHALMLGAPVLAGLILTAPVVAILSLANTLLAAAVPAQASSPAAARELSTVLCTGYKGCVRHGYHSYGYSRWEHHSYWRMSAGDECTNYVAYVESTMFRVRAPDYLLGNAYQWPARAAAHGVTVNHKPSVGAIAEWGPHAYGVGPDGHVAVVEKVGPHDRYIVISQQHIMAEANGYDWTRINAGFPRTRWQSWPSHFIHFKIRHRP
jgi:surface antigen